MQEMEVIRFLLENANYICIPLGFVARYFLRLLFKSKEESDIDVSPQTEVFVDKIYEYMKELRDGRDDAIEERAQLLMRNKVLRDKLKDLKKITDTLNTQIAAHLDTAVKLKARYDELDLRYDELLRQHEVLLLTKPTGNGV